MNSKPLIFDIKRYAINDGPGVRVTIFFKGCPLKCRWCHNPESISAKMEKMYAADKCIGALSCIKDCPENALTITPEHGIVTNLTLCTMCGECTVNCPTGAMEMVAEMADIDSIIQAINEERDIIEQSGGGVTFSGGEPLMHHQFLSKALLACKAEGFHRTVDTSGYASQEVLLELAPNVDHWLYDLKVMDTELHAKWTGIGNERILANLRILANTGASIDIRIPLIDGVNADDNNITATAEFVASLAGDKKQVNVLPYHKTAENKYRKLDKEVNLVGMAEPSQQRQEQVVKIFESYGINAIIGG